MTEQSTASLDDQQHPGTPPDKPDEQSTYLLTPSPSTRDDSIPQPLSDDVLPSSTLRDSPTLGGEEDEHQQERRLGRLLPVQYDTKPDPGAARGNRAPLAAHINADTNPNLIIEGPRNRRRVAHAAKVISNAHCEQTFLGASMCALLKNAPTGNYKHTP